MSLAAILGLVAAAGLLCGAAVGRIRTRKRELNRQQEAALGGPVEWRHGARCLGHDAGDIDQLDGFGWLALGAEGLDFRQLRPRVGITIRFREIEDVARAESFAHPGAAHRSSGAKIVVVRFDAPGSSTGALSRIGWELPDPDALVAALVERGVRRAPGP